MLLLLLSVQLSFGQGSRHQIDSLSRQLQISTGNELVLAQVSLASLVMTIDTELSDSLLNVALKSSERSGFSEGKIRAILVQAAVANYRSRLDKSRSLLDEAIKLSEESQFDEGLAYAYTTLGSQLLRSGNYAEAIDYHFKGSGFAKTLGLFDVEVTNLMNIGLIKQRIGELGESERYLKEAISICEENGLDFRQAQLWVNLGVLEFNRQNTGLSIDYNRKALTIFDALGDKHNTAFCNQNIGFAYASLKDKDLSYQYYDEAIAIRKEINDQAGIARVLLNKGKYERDDGQLEAASSFGKEAIELVEGSGNRRLLTDIYLFLSEVYQAQKNYQQAMTFQKKYSVNKDSLQSAINETRIAELTSQFEFDRQEKALLVAQNEAQLLKSRQLALSLVALVLLAAIVIVIMVARQKIALKQLEKELALDKARISQLQEDKLAQELEVKRLELGNYADQLKQKNQVITNIKTQLENLKTEERERLVEFGLESLSKEIESRTSGVISWEEFRLKFDAVHTNFVRDLVSNHGNLTKNEIDLCILLKVNLTHKDISHILNIEYDSVKKSIQRLFRKLGFNSSDELRAHLLKI